MELPEETAADIRRRLRRVEGQVRGIQQMLDEHRDCRDVVTQISAASKALEQAGFLLVAAGLRYCVADPENSSAEGYDIESVQKMFLRLA
jgi:DNA-binding FrmR family transcriptional regulator